MSRTTVQIRTDSEIKQASDDIFRSLGITISDAINIFLRQSILHRGFPFEVKLPRTENHAMTNHVNVAADTDVDAVAERLLAKHIEAFEVLAK
ncbi:MAG: type II toxin-antitoxin system RelB/DinJ family antitoxin [Fusobacteriaceae bacterium]|nr:type II toxin-antitoxin system RelB/DinJ family antitoxin [Fusobacteriaceae bacterium]